MRGAKQEVAARQQSAKLEQKRHEAASQLQRFSRTRAAKIEVAERRTRKEAAVRAGRQTDRPIFGGDLLIYR